MTGKKAPIKAYRIPNGKFFQLISNQPIIQILIKIKHLVHRFLQNVDIKKNQVDCAKLPRYRKSAK